MLSMFPLVAMTNNCHSSVIPETSKTSELEKEAMPIKEAMIGGNFLHDGGEGDCDFDPNKEAEEGLEIDQQEEEVDETEEEHEQAEPELTMLASKVAPAKKKIAPAPKSKSVDELLVSFQKLGFRDFDMSFKFPYMVLEHRDHGQKLASIDLLIIGVHCRHVHLKIFGNNSDVLQVKVAVPSHFYTPN